MNKTPRIIGSGWHVPKEIRKNNDPIFNWLRENHPNGKKKYFAGYENRHVLTGDEALIDIMLPAAIMALKKANKRPEDIDYLIGIGSISKYIMPNMLSEVHKRLGLPESTWVIPVTNDYSNFGSSLIFADSLIRSNRAKNILICLGGNWTKNVNYHTGQAISAGDGAGAAVMSNSDDTSNWYVADQCTVTDTTYFGSMYTNGLPVTVNPPVTMNGANEVYYKELFSPHFFQITKKGLDGFKEFGAIKALSAVTKLLKKNNLSTEDISFMPQQTSQYLIDHWCENLKPPVAQVLSTIKLFANATVATPALNFAYFEEKGTIEKNNMVIMSLGVDMHCNALLLKRKNGK